MVFLGFGSNIGDRKKYLEGAIHRLVEKGYEISLLSGMYETAPWGDTDQPAFLNRVAGMEVPFQDPHDLLEDLLATEREFGRERTRKWGPRTLDLDILDFRGRSVSSPGLTLPHPGIPNRAFVLVPWAEIAPDHLLPGMKQSISELLALLPDTEKNSVHPFLY